MEGCSINYGEKDRMINLTNKSKTAKFSRTKITSIAVAIFLIFSMTASLMFVPTASAHTPPMKIVTNTYVAVSMSGANATGVGQPVEIVFWSQDVPPSGYGPYGDRWSFNVNVTQPDGTTVALGPFISDVIGSGYTLFTPTQVGTYTVVAYFPQQTTTGSLNNPNGPPASYFTMAGLNVFINDTYLASQSSPTTFNVQSAPLPAFTETPLPDSYWTRPVYGFNRNWASVMGEWLGISSNVVFGNNGANNPYRANDAVQPPESSHILWSRPVWDGGITGGPIGGDITYHSGTAYESLGAPTIVTDGRVYYNIQGADQPNWGWYCVDLYTGKTIYFDNNTNGQEAIPTFAQTYDYYSPNQHGTFSYLYRTSGVVLPAGNTNMAGTVAWQMLDAYTGNPICKIANVSSGGTAATDSIGDILRYSIAAGATVNGQPTEYLRIWNLTSSVAFSGTAGTAVWYWRPAQTPVVDGNTCWSLNVSIPVVQGTVRAVVVGQEIIGGTTGEYYANGTIVQGNLWALNLATGQEGKLLWNYTFTPPQDSPQTTLSQTDLNNLEPGKASLVAVDPVDGVFIWGDRILGTWNVYSLATGQLMWTQSLQNQYYYYSMGFSIYQGSLYSYNLGGVLIDFNITTGAVLWNWSAPFVGLGEEPYTYAPLAMGCMSQGNLYVYSTEHHWTEPFRRDLKIYDINATTGQLIWSQGCAPAAAPIIADGRILVLDNIDNSVYCYGKGSSGTTVSAPQSDALVGSTLTLTGTVTDQTPSGRINIAGDNDFLDKGTPAISDASMDAWMNYMYHQGIMPTNATGVPVSLDAIDPNGNYIHIGTVTSDVHSNYGCEFTPQVPGTYQILATFAGSNSYGPSSASTYLAVGQAPATPAPTAVPLNESAIESSIMSYVIFAVIAIIIAIAVVGVLLLRKHA